MRGGIERMFLIKLAFKNLFRHRRRTLITAAIIASAVFIFLFIDSLLLGMEEASYENIINYSTSHIQVVNYEYWQKKDEMPLSNLLSDSEEIKAAAGKIEGLQGFSEKLVFKARLNNGRDELPIQGVGMNSKNIENTLDLKEKVIEGSFFQENKNQAVLGYKLADLMEVEVGDVITLLIRNKQDTFNTIELEISGLLQTPNPDVNQSKIFLPLSIAQKGLNVEGETSHLLIKLNNNNKTSMAVSTLEKEKNENSGIKIVPWNQLTAVSIVSSKEGANQVILGIILLLAAIGIINTVILSALERMEEIGMMKAMGLRKNEIIISFILESTGLGIIGGIMGCLAGLVAIFFFSKVGIDFGALYGIEMGSFGIPLVDKIYGAWNLDAFIFVFVFSVFVSLLASILPARWAAKKDPVQAIYHR
ncbi:MAG: ABC transporter permease [Halanaerobiales bacterium]